MKFAHGLVSASMLALSLNVAMADNSFKFDAVSAATVTMGDTTLTVCLMFLGSQKKMGDFMNAALSANGTRIKTDPGIKYETTTGQKVSGLDINGDKFSVKNPGTLTMCYNPGQQDVYADAALPLNLTVDLGANVGKFTLKKNSIFTRKRN